jgi:hypothetical protein
MGETKSQFLKPAPRDFWITSFFLEMSRFRTCPPVLYSYPFYFLHYPSILLDNDTLLILNRGGEICSLLHKGQRPGVLRRVRFLKEKPHC